MRWRLDGEDAVSQGGAFTGSVGLWPSSLLGWTARDADLFPGEEQVSLGVGLLPSAVSGGWNGRGRRPFPEAQGQAATEFSLELGLRGRFTRALFLYYGMDRRERRLQDEPLSTNVSRKRDKDTNDTTSEYSVKRVWAMVLAFNKLKPRMHQCIAMVRISHRHKGLPASATACLRDMDKALVDKHWTTRTPPQVK